MNRVDKRDSVIIIWVILFWSVFAIQLVPRLFGGTINVIIYFSFVFLFLLRSGGKSKLNLSLVIGILLYSFIVFILLNEKNTIVIAGIEMNYSAYKTLFWVMGIASASMFLQQAKGEQLNKFRSIYFPVIILNMISNLIITVFIDPTASKFAGKTSDYIIGVSDFDTVYAAVLIVPIILFFIFDSNKQDRKKWIVLFIIALLYVIKASFLIAILAAILGIVLVLIDRLQNVTGKLLVTLLMVAVIVFITIRMDILFDAMIYISNRINNATISTRLIELVGVLRDGKEAADGVARLDVYSKMFEGFLKHPILGCIISEPEIFTNYAGHSTILDMLCGYGLFTCVPLFLGFNKLIKSIKKMMPAAHQRVYQCCYWVFLFIALFNPVTNGYLMTCTIITVPYALLYSSRSLNGELDL